MKKIVSLFSLFILISSFLSVPKVSAQPLIDNVASDVESDQVNLENLGIAPEDSTTPTEPDRSFVYEWYIKDFQSEIIVNKDSSLDITERILADCGDLPNKHGIFRILPTVYYKEAGKPIKAPIKLISITDFEGNPYNYSTIKSSADKTLTWKIGDADVAVSGVNNYLIKYRVKNTTRFDNTNFDEFYWNLSGNFWDMEIDHYSAKITFPEEINKDNTEVNNYIGSYGTSTGEMLDAQWVAPNILQISTKSMLPKMVGVTTSVTFPKNIVSPPILTFWDKYGDKIPYLFLLIPILCFMLCYSLWKKYGNDKALARSVAPEFEIPEKMDPIKMGIFMENGKQNTKFLSAAIVNLAVKGFIKIEEIPKKGILSSADTKLIKLKETEDGLSGAEKKLIEGLFGAQSDVLISDLKNKFYKNLEPIKKAAMNELLEKKYFEEQGFNLQGIFWAVSGLMFVGIFFIPAILSAFLEGDAIVLMYVSFILTIIIFAVFGIFMPKRSESGQDLLWRIKGFQLYMKTAERYRQQFNEKENIFERFLPYAMLFGITGLWIKKMKELYGEEYFNTYHPIWYVGNFGGGGFDLDGFTSQLNSISSSMASSMSSSPSSSGSGGGGFSGGGGGGGGGGGW